jgi:hypothetical protein
MISTLISIIITLIVVGVIFWAVQTLLPLIPLPEPFRRIIYVLMVVILVLIVVYVIAGLLGASVGGMRFSRIVLSLPLPRAV